MKNTLFLLFFVSFFTVSAQRMGFNVGEFSIHDSMEDEMIEAFDKALEGVVFDGGGIVLERLWNGRESHVTHRIVWMFTLGKDMIKSGLNQDKQEAFWAKMQTFVKEWNTGYAGRMLSWKEGNTDENSFGHIYDIKVSDPAKFKTAHDKIVKQHQDIFKDRVVGFGTYDMGRPNGATHWVALTGKDRMDHLMVQDELEKRSNFIKLLGERGPVEEVKDFEIQILRRAQ